MTPEKYPASDKAFQEPTRLGAFPLASGKEVQQSREHTIAYLRLFWSKRGHLLRVFLVSFAISTLVVFLIPKRYEAATKLMPPDSQSGTNMAMLSALSARGSGALGGLAGDLLGMKSSGALFQGILSSRTVQDRLIQQFDLQRVYGDSKIEDARKDLAQHTTISEDRKSGIITVSVWDHDPKRAAAMAGAYVNELDRLVAEVSTSAARRERIFLEGRLQSVKQELDATARNFSQFASKNAAIDIPAQGKAMVEAAAKLQGELIVAESELSGMQAIYTDQNARVRALRARVTELHAQLSKLSGNGGGVTNASGENYPSIRQLPLLGVTYADLYRQTKIEETVFELLTQQYELAKVQEAKEIPSVKVLDVPVVPTKKIFPARTPLILASTLACMLLACVLVIAREWWRVIAPQDPRKQFVGEIVQTLQSDAGRLAPKGSLLRRMISRNGTRPNLPVDAVLEPEQQPSDDSPEVARAARSSE